jgi:hypothetical protein
MKDSVQYTFHEAEVLLYVPASKPALLPFDLNIHTNQVCGVEFLYTAVLPWQS